MKFILSLFFLSCVTLACTSGDVQTENTNISKSNDTKPVELLKCKPPKDSLELSVSGVEVTYLPNSDSTTFKGTILLLPGWNFSRMDWCNKASLCDKARAKGYAFVLPEMGKSIYASQYYPESRKDWTKFPTGSWVTDTLIPYLQNEHCILTMDQNNFLCGLSTGARGAVLMALNTDSLFDACAALSGDYHQGVLPKDNLMRGIYGELSDFPDRWNGRDNIFHRAKELITPLYIAHSQMDKVVDFNQSSMYVEELLRVNPELKIEYNWNPKGGHDYTYWDSETEFILSFFEKFNQ